MAPSPYPPATVPAPARDTRALPWHRLSPRLPATPPTPAELLPLAGLDWQVTLRPVWTTDTDGRLLEVPDRQAVVQVPGDVVLGDVGKWYSCYQNESLLEFGQVLADKLPATWDTAGPLRGGRAVWIMFSLPRPAPRALPPGLSTWLLVTTSHDGSTAVTARALTVHDEAATVLALDLPTTPSLVRFRHIGDVGERFAQAERIGRMVATYERALAGEINRLSAVDIPHDRFVADLVPAILPEHRGRPHPPPNAAQAVSTVRLMAARRSLADHAGRSALEAGSHSAWGRLLATAEWAQWQKSLIPDPRVPPAEQRFLSVLTGPAAELLARAHKALNQATRANAA